QIAQERGIKLTQRATKELTAQARAAEIAARAEQKRQVAVLLAAQGLDPQGRSARDIAAEIAARAEQKRQVAALLAAQGLDPQGRPIQAARTAQDIAAANLRR